MTMPPSEPSANSLIAEGRVASIVEGDLCLVEETVDFSDLLMHANETNNKSQTPQLEANVQDELLNWLAAASDPESDEQPDEVSSDVGEGDTTPPVEPIRVAKRRIVGRCKHGHTLRFCGEPGCREMPGSQHCAIHGNRDTAANPCRMCKLGGQEPTYSKRPSGRNPKGKKWDAQRLQFVKK